MKKCLASFALVFLNLLVYTSTAQAQEYAFNRVPLFEENVKGFITGIAQDSKGYMWFTGVNLYRYDGYHLVTYKNDPLDSNSIAPSRLESIYIDSKGIIWIGTFGSGLDRFDPATGIFTHFHNNPGDQASLSNNIVTAIIEDNEGTLWVGSQNGLNRMDKKKGKFARYLNIANDSTSLSNDQVRALYLDRQGTIWVGCGSPFGNESPPGAGGLNRLDRKTGKFIRYMHDPKNPNSLFDNKVRAISEDSHGNFWIGTANGGLHIMDRQKGTFKRFLYDPLHHEKLSSPQKKGDFFHVTFIHEDITGGIWIGAFPGGLNHFDPNTSKVTRYEANKDDPEGIQENSVWYAFSSRDGVLWISTQFYVYRIDPLRKHISHINISSRVNAFLDEDSNAMWIGTDKGLIRSSLNKGDTAHFINDSLKPGSISNNVVLSLYKDRKNNLWVGTANGLNLYNPETKKFTRYQHNAKSNNSISEGSVLSIFEDREMMFWIGTEGGLDMMDRQTGLFKHFRHNSKDSNSLSNNTVKCILEDRSGNFWIGTWSRGGINRMDRKTGKFKRYLEGSNVVNIFQDSEGIIWVATEFGLYKRNNNTGEFSRFSEPGSELGTANIVGILEDNKKNLWLGSLSGILKLNSRRNETSIYGKKYGVNANSLLDMVGYKTQHEELLFGDATGYYAFFPDQITTNTKAPQIILTDFKIADLLIKPGNGSPLIMPIEETKEITLNYKQNVFSFDFAGIHYSSPEENSIFLCFKDMKKVGAKRVQRKQPTILTYRRVSMYSE